MKDAQYGDVSVTSDGHVAAAGDRPAAAQLRQRRADARPGRRARRYRRRAGLPRLWCWHRPARASAPGPTSPRRPAEGGGWRRAQSALCRGGAAVLGEEADRGGRSRARRSGAGWAWRWWPISASSAPEARFAANFVKLGFHPGFGLTHTLPRLIGMQRASLMFYTGRRIPGERSARMGSRRWLAAPRSAARCRQRSRARNRGERARWRSSRPGRPCAAGLAEAVRAQTDHEFAEQSWLIRTEDHKEGVRSVNERRPGRFEGR